ncbi:MAG: hypothetical protein UX17_C0012G0024 [Parcubacteria group bacterium GW2011_GWC2_45_7]|nr:MAG: hypothetical protein UX17_C0012G0024 [Parcubacteria group bacterium GW2011_GWC2_45_7]KKU73711.1 MAG: hypothetical protein UX98_C0005G0087 [Parcubacteria group bacterium GW2011_GWA2_47_26]
MRRFKLIVLLIIISAAIVGLGAFGLRLRNRPESQPVAVSVLRTEQKYRRALDGIFVTCSTQSCAEEMRPPFAGVMVENMVEAQPISGLAQANFVIEAITESNITRFLTFYTLEEGREIAKIGPVRSARPYYLDFAAELDSLYAHVGSSPAAYELLRKVGVEGVYDLDQWYNSQYFWRDNGRERRAPHNVFSSAELLRKAYGEQNIDSKFESWQFKDDAPPDLRGNVNDIRVSYFAPYNVQWLYDKSANIYKRMQWGGIHRDAQWQEIVAKNIAVAFQKMEVLDNIGRKKFTTIGKGKGLVFQDGRVVVGTWKKPSARERLRFYDGEGKEVEFNAGVSWVHIMPEGYNVAY